MNGCKMWHVICCRGLEEGEVTSGSFVSQGEGREGCSCFAFLRQIGKRGSEFDLGHRDV